MSWVAEHRKSGLVVTHPLGDALPHALDSLAACACSPAVEACKVTDSDGDWTGVCFHVTHNAFDGRQ